MGNKNYYNVRAASLNFSSISLSPFEYYQNGQNQIPLVQMYERVLKDQMGSGQYKWNVGKIDKKLQKERYAPIYRNDVCVLNDKLVTKLQFFTLWQKQYQRNSPLIFKDELPTQTQKEQTKLFDWITYKSLCLVAYNLDIDHLDKNLQKIKNYDSRIFQKFLIKYHSKGFLDHKKKLKQIRKFLQKGYCDILFLQEAQLKNNLKWRQQVPQNFDVQQRQGSESVIIFNKNKFQIDLSKQSFFQLYKDKLNFNNDTVFIKCKNYLLLSIHLSSKKNKENQVRQMFDKLTEIRKDHPFLQIIAGIHCQTFLNYKFYQDPKYQFAPFDNEKPTTFKKRTTLQVQSHKANIEDKSVKSHIVTNRKINLSFVGKISGEKSTILDYLPKQDHPFDHFLIGADIYNQQILKVNDRLSIGSLNFSGICLSPFQFYDQSQQKVEFSKLFAIIMKKQFKQENFEWKVGKIDQKLQVERYTPIYRKKVCIQNNTLINRQQFNNLWDIQFNKSSHFLKSAMPTTSEINQCRTFDWIAYQTIINYLYNRNNPQLFNFNKIKSLDPKQFQQFLNRWHSKKYLSNKIKIKQIMKILQQYDLLFLQEAKLRSNFSWSIYLPNQFEIQQTKNSESLIIYRKNKFSPDLQKKKFDEKYSKLLQFNSDSVYLKTKDFLFVSVHLTSKSHNKDQFKQMMTIYKQIRNQYPNLQIINGIDANFFINPKLYPQFYIQPLNKNIPTSAKKRTSIQLQTKKANKLISEVKDSLLSTVYLQNFRIQTIEKNKISKDSFLPTQQHPFDHFLISADIDINKSQSQIKASTLNFSGICLSPFQYYDSSTELEELSKLFEKIMKTDQLTNISKFSWDVGKIDQKLQKQRYTPIYNSNVCIKNNRLVNKNEFINEWNMRFQNNKHKLKDNVPTQKQLNHARTFDWLSYLTLLNFVYNKNQNSFLKEEDINKLNPIQFQKKLNEWHSKSYLDNNKKLYIIKEYLETVDLMFLQQTQKESNQIWRNIIQFDQYESESEKQGSIRKIESGFKIITRENSESMIIFKKSKFAIDQYDTKLFYEKWCQKINFNRDTVFIKTQKYLLISTHLTSKDTHVKQAKELFQTLKQIKKQYPTLQIIIGTDSNHFINLKQHPQYKIIQKPLNKIKKNYLQTQSQALNTYGIMVAPADQLMPTNVKTRTSMQLQTKKANISVANVKSHIISTMNAIDYNIQMIDKSKITKKVTLPTNNHPFDHFLIKVSLVNHNQN